MLYNRYISIESCISNEYAEFLLDLITNSDDSELWQFLLGIGQ